MGFQRCPVKICRFENKKLKLKKKMVYNFKKLKKKLLLFFFEKGQIKNIYY
jgi:hypothetical protein